MGVVIRGCKKKETRKGKKEKKEKEKKTKKDEKREKVCGREKNAKSLDKKFKN